MIEINNSMEKDILQSFRKDMLENDLLKKSKRDFVSEVRNGLIDKEKLDFQKLNINQLIKKIKLINRKLTHTVKYKSVGTVQHIGNGVATLSGLPEVQLEEIIIFPNGVQGMVLNLDRDHVDVILLGPDQGIRGGDLAQSTGQRLSVPVGLQYLGRVVGPLGNTLDDFGPITPTEFRHVDKIAPGIIDRSPVNEPLYTGTKILDALIPLGRGQRELILGDRQTGKTTLAIDTILNQKGTDVKCIYVAIAQKKTSVITAISTLRDGGMMAQTSVIVSSSDDPPALRYLAPYAGVTLAEFLLDQGQDVLIVYDDLTKHADSYRELSLLLRRPPGREAYPGDIFYLHSRLLERACKLSSDLGGGSITALPIVTTQKGNLAGYIPTNLISITDGQIMLDANLFNKGIKPAIDISRSVSRVGGAAQEQAMKTMVGPLKLELSQYEEVARFARLGTEVNEATQRQIDRGVRLESLLSQGPHQPVSLSEQVILFFALTENYLDEIPAEDIPQLSQDLLQHFHNHENKIIDEINFHRALDGILIEALHEAMKNFLDIRLAQERGAV
ncbi:MAG: F0F1 ATP synthase subunit alpha [Anaerolineaceae bacterium]|nr:F0F1 ATP synthase subunit alpha [Anaerolineaceae bacterium]